MQIINYVCASLLKSSYSAFKLARGAQNDLDFAKKLISVKSKNAHVRLDKLKKDSVEYDLTKLKTQQYDNFLNRIKNMQMADKEVCSLN